MNIGKITTAEMVTNFRGARSIFGIEVEYIRIGSQMVKLHLDNTISWSLVNKLDCQVFGAVAKMSRMWQGVSGKTRIR